MTTAQTIPLGSEDPAELGSYTLLGKLGQGGMGTVYLGRSERGRLVAIKVIKADVADEAEFRARFRIEAETARRVKRLCTAEVLDADPDAEQPYLVTEFIEGMTLSKWVAQNGPLADANLEQLAVGVVTALTAIHSAGIVHRDLKPANVVLSPFGPRVIDFGIARALDSAINLTGDLQQLGTPAFMSPEQIEGGQTITPAVDVWAWGGVVTYAATGRYPFGEGNAQVLLYRALHEDPRLDGLDEALRPIVWHAMRKDPANRPSAQQLMVSLLGESPSTPAEEAEREVTQLLQDWKLPTPAGPAGAGAPHTGTYPGALRTGGTGAGSDTRTQIVTGGAGQGGAGTGGPTTDYPPTRAGQRPPAKRRTGLLIAGIAAAVAAILAAVFLVVLSGDDGTEPFALPAAATALSNDTVVYASQEGSRYSIVSGRIGADGLLTEPKKITSDEEADNLLPVIMPDRKTVLYYRSTSPGTLYAIAADGTGEPVQLLTSGPAANLTIADDARPSVSPDGKFMVIRSTTDETGNPNTGLYVTPMDGSSVRRLQTKPQATDPAWSPDGERIAYFSNNAGGDGGFIVVIPVAVGGEPVPVTEADGPDLDADPVWSPDGNQIVFRRAEGSDLNNKEIWIMNPNGSNQRPLTDLNGAQDPTFSPRLSGNTSQLVFTAPRAGDGDRELFVMANLGDPSQIRQITDHGGNDTHPRWNSG